MLEMGKTVDGKEIRVKFSYEESCNNVYKHFQVEVNGKKSNVKGLKKYLSNPDSIPGIISANTYFWNSGNCASWRRSNEVKRMNEVETWLISEGFKAV